MDNIKNEEILTESQKEVRELYERSGLSYTALAELLGINRSTLARWLNGSRTPSKIALEFMKIKVEEHLSNKAE